MDVGTRPNDAAANIVLNWTKSKRYCLMMTVKEINMMHAADVIHEDILVQKAQFVCL